MNDKVIGLTLDQLDKEELGHSKSKNKVERRETFP